MTEVNLTKSSELDLSVNPDSPPSGPTSRGRRSAVRRAATVRAAATARTARSPRTAHKHPAAVLFTMLAVGGMFGVMGLPAYAVNPTDAAGAPEASSLPAQSFVANADATISAARDGFSATTPEELSAAKLAAEQLATQQTSAAARVRNYVYTDPGPRQAGDDYPFSGMGEGLSPLRYYMGECVDFVAWRLNRDAGSTSAPFKWDWSTLTPGGGSANSWTSAWENHGWPISSTPVAGAVAVTGYMHVAYVKEVLGDGAVLLEEYNYGGYHQYGQRVISAGSATYLYPPG